MLPESKRNQIKKLIKNWLKNSFKRMLKLNKEELYPNPFLMRAIGIKEESREFYEFAIRQRLERSLSTSFGMSVFEGIVKTLNGKANLEDIDLIIEKGGKRYYIQLKSGPQGFTRPALRKTKQSFQMIKEKDSNAVTVIAFAYGKRDLLSPIWGEEAKQSADMLLIGEEFWDFFFGKGTYMDILNLCEEASQEVLKELGIQGDNIVKFLMERLLKAT